MFAELEQVLGSTKPDARSDDYAKAIVEDNVAEKKTASTRRVTAQRLRELYALDRALPRPAAPVGTECRRSPTSGPSLRTGARPSPPNKRANDPGDATA